MRPPAHELEDGLRAAVRLFVSSIDPDSRVFADISPLSAATARLPLSRLSHWERVIRQEFALAQGAKADSWKNRWRTPRPFLGSKAPVGLERFLTWVDLSSGDGFVRERTLRTLAGAAPNRFFLALAACRLNDWVPQVRLAAREAMPALARASDPEHVVDVLCAMLPAWTAWGRMEALDRHVMTQLVSMDPITTSLLRRLISTPDGPLSAVLSQALRTAALDEHLGQIATEAVQPAVRAIAHRTLLMGKAVWLEAREWQWTDVRYCQGRMKNILGVRAISGTPAVPESLGLAISDRSSVVRRVAAESLMAHMENLGEAALPLAQRLADDASRTIAKRGMFIVQRLTEHG